MDALDKFFKKFSYKFPKGYPDINDAQDMLMLEGLLKEIGIELNEVAKKPFDNLSPEAQELAKIISKELNIPLDNFFSTTKDRMLIVAPENTTRREVASKLEKLDINFTRKKIPGSGFQGFQSDIKGLKTNVEIILKDATTQRRGDAGLVNEKLFIETINNYIEQAGGIVNIFIKGSNGITSEIKNAKKAIEKGRDTSDNKKSDVDIITTDGKQGISLKKDGGFRWASAQKFDPELYDRFLSNALTGNIPNFNLKPDPKDEYTLQMLDNNGRVYGRAFITDHPSLEEDFKIIAFGTDEVIVVQRDFTESDFSLEGKNLIINATKVYETVDQIPEEERPVIEFERNSSKATKTQGYRGRGIIMRISPIKVLLRGTSRGNKFVIPYDEIPSSVAKI